MVKLIELNNTNVKLLYQASKDGFDPSIFHSKCDGVSSTLIVIKSKNSNIFGGFTSADWSGNDFKSDSTAFLFSLVNSYNVSVKMETSSDGNNAIYSYPSYGITFGRGSDLFCSYDQCGSYLNSDSHSYKLPNFLTQVHYIEAQSFLGGRSSFQAVEIEIYWIDRNIIFEE